MAAGPKPDDTAGREAKVLRNLWLRLIAGAGASAAIMLTWAMKIDDIRDKPQTPVVAAGERIDTGPFALRLFDARLSATTPDGMTPFDGKPVLIVRAEAENLASASRNDFGEMLPKAGGRRVEFYLSDDRSPLSYLDPRLPQRVEIVLPLADAAPPEITVPVIGRSYKQRDNLTGASGWFSPRTVAQVKLPVEPMR